MGTLVKCGKCGYLVMATSKWCPECGAELLNYPFKTKSGS